MGTSEWRRNPSKIGPTPHPSNKITKMVAVGGLLGFLFAVTAFGQPKTLLPVDHPELYASYCFFMEEFGKALDARGATIQPRIRQS